MQESIRLILNDRDVISDQPKGSTVLDFIRHQQRLLGTKIGCREGDCGACTVLVGHWDGHCVRYQAMTSCLMPLGNVNGKHLVTIEGLNHGELTPVQQAIVEEGATQCGFCTPGFAVSLTGYCLSGQAPTTANAIAAMDGNICRCTGYKSLQRAAARIHHQLEAIDLDQPLPWLVDHGFLPAYFREIPKRLQAMASRITLPATTVPKRHAFMGGGTDLLVQKPEAAAKASLEFLFGRGAMQGIEIDNGKCRIGAATTTEALRQSPLLASIIPGMASFMDLVSSTPIRHMATVGGNLVNASPIGDLSIFFLGLDAVISLQNQGRLRTLPLREFFLDYKVLNKDANEILAAIWFEPFTKATRFNFEKVSKRRHLDIASVNSALRLEMNDGRIDSASLAAGGVAPVPKFLAKTSAFLTGQHLSNEVVQNALAILDEEISPISDVRGSAEYKRLLLKQQVIGHFLTLCPQSLSWEVLV